MGKLSGQRIQRLKLQRFWFLIIGDNGTMAKVMSNLLMKLFKSMAQALDAIGPIFQHQPIGGSKNRRPAFKGEGLGALDIHFGEYKTLQIIHRNQCIKPVGSHFNRRAVIFMIEIFTLQRSRAHTMIP
jgi:hypothetical protein